MLNRGERALWQAVTADVTGAKPKTRNRPGTPARSMLAAPKRPLITKGGAKRDPDAHPARPATSAMFAKQHAKQSATELVREPAGRSVPAQKPRLATSSGYTAHAPNICLNDAVQARKVARGRVTIEARLDLHDLTQNEAFNALTDFLERAQALSHKCVLVITGKDFIRPELARAKPGRYNRDHDFLNRGVLRRQLPLWVQTRFSDKVISIATAHIKHGGNGAYYLFLRKAR